MNMFDETKINPVYFNPDGEMYYDEVADKFSDAFSFEQRNILLSALDSKLPADLIAYPGITPERMACLAFFMETFMEHADDSELTRMDIWKCGQLNISLEETELILKCCKYGVKPIDEIKDVTKIGAQKLQCILYGAQNGVNLCKYMPETMSDDEFIKLSEKKVSKAERKRILIWKINKLRFPYGRP